MKWLRGRAVPSDASERYTGMVDKRTALSAKLKDNCGDGKVYQIVVDLLRYSLYICRPFSVGQADRQRRNGAELDLWVNHWSS